MQDEDDDIGVKAMYEDGHWIWDTVLEQLVFKSNTDEIIDTEPNYLTVKNMEFNDDVDVLEEQRFRKRYQRKMEDNDVVTLQDIKDIVIFVTPVIVVTTYLVNILHLPSTDRFLRALILYSQYYLQTADELNRRELEQKTKVRTSLCDKVLSELQENTEDLRLLVANQYSNLVLAEDEYTPYHHMGPSKDKRSLTQKDSVMFETLLRVCIHIVWLALGRKSYNELNIEIHRLFKTSIYNYVEHNNQNENSKMEAEQKYVLQGHCKKTAGILNTRSPLMNELFCHRKIDFRMMGLGVIHYPTLTPRLRYFEHCLIAPEMHLFEMNISLGIIGLRRCRFDTMLREIGTSSAQTSQHSKKSMSRVASKSSKMSKKSTIQEPLYHEIRLPDNSDDEVYNPPKFPDVSLPYKYCSETHRQKWLARINAFNMKNKKQIKKRKSISIKQH